MRARSKAELGRIVIAVLPRPPGGLTALFEHDHAENPKSGAGRRRPGWRRGRRCGHSVANACQQTRPRVHPRRSRFGRSIVPPGCWRNTLSGETSPWTHSSTFFPFNVVQAQIVRPGKADRRLPAGGHHVCAVFPAGVKCRPRPPWVVGFPAPNADRVPARPRRTPVHSASVGSTLTGAPAATSGGTGRAWRGCARNCLGVEPTYDSTGSVVAAPLAVPCLKYRRFPAPNPPSFLLRTRPAWDRERRQMRNGRLMRTKSPADHFVADEAVPIVPLSAPLMNTRPEPCERHGMPIRVLMRPCRGAASAGAPPRPKRDVRREAWW